MRSLFLPLLFLATMLPAAEPLDLAAALRHPQLTLTITGGTPLLVTVKNHGLEPVTIRPAAGVICQGMGSELRIVSLRAVEISVAARSAAEVQLPSAVIRTGQTADSFAPTAETEPRLTPLLGYFATHDDIPRLTAQLLVRCVLEDLSFATWQRSLGGEPAPEQVVAAIDALGILRTVAPEKTFALALDPELKLRALRNPVARGKAMQLYGIDLPEAPLPPELGTLLHTKSGDNCPICRQRALMQPGEGGL